MIEIAPKVFVQSWDEISRGYVHGNGNFIIDFKEGTHIVLNDPYDVRQAVEHWRGLSVTPFEPQEQKIPADIAFWMKKRQARKLA